MQYFFIISMIFLLVGCAGSPPNPPVVKGEYRPINRIETFGKNNYKDAVSQTFSFRFEGDIVASLQALRAVQSQLNVLPPLGEILSLPITIDLHDTTLENVLGAIDEQGGDVADVVFNTDQNQGGNQVFIRFRDPDKQLNEETTTPSVTSN